MGYIGVIAHLLTIDPNFQRDIQVPMIRIPDSGWGVSKHRQYFRSGSTRRYVWYDQISRHFFLILTHELLIGNPHWNLYQISKAVYISSKIVEFSTCHLSFTKEGSSLQFIKAWKWPLVNHTPKSLPILTRWGKPPKVVRIFNNSLRVGT